MTKKHGTMRLKLPARASIYYLAASASAKIIGVLTTPIFTRLLSGEGYGEYTLYITRLGFLSMTLTALISGAEGYRALSEFKENSDEYISSLLGSAFAFCAVICTLLFTFMSILGLNSLFVIILTLQLLCDVIFAVSNMRARFFYSYKQVFFSSFIQSVLSVLLSIVLIEGAGLGYKARIWGLLIASLTVAVPLLLKMLRRYPGLFSFEMWKKIFKRAFPLLPHAVSSALSLQIDRFIITAVLGTAALAKYSVAYSFSASLTVFTGAVSSALSPWMIRKLSSGRCESVASICTSLFLLVCCAALALVSVAPEAMRILAPENYADSAVAVAPIALSAIPSLMCSLGATVLISSGGSSIVSLSAMISSFSAISLGFLLIPSLGYLGAGLAHLLSQSVGAIAVLVPLLKNKTRIFQPFSLFAAFSVATVLSLVAVGIQSSFLRIGTLLFAASFAIFRLVGIRGLISEN